MNCLKLSPISENYQLLKLLKYVQRNDLSSIEKLIRRHQDLISAEYQHPFEPHDILIIACNECVEKNDTKSVSGSTILKLIELDAKCVKPTKDDQWESIHYVAINGNKDKLSTILKHLTVEEANSLVHCSRHVARKFPCVDAKDVPRSYSNNALNILLKYAKRTEQFRDCCKLLIEKGVDVYQADSNGVTPLDLMKKEEFSDLVRLSESQSVPKKKIAFELVQFDRAKELLSRNFTMNEMNDVDGSSEDLSSCTLLQVCCKKGLTDCVKFLLDKGASPNKTILKNQNTPLMIAIQEDHEQAVQLLLNNKYLVLPRDILVKIQLKSRRLKNAMKIDKYFQVLLKHLETYTQENRKKYLYASDELDRTALHYAVQYRSSENVLDLLQLGAPLTKRDIFGFSSLHSIEPSLLEKFLDNCIKVPKNSEDMENMFFALRNSKDKFSLEIDYEALTSENLDGKVHESEFLFQLIKMKKLRYLLNHPVILSYLEVKWRKFKYVVFINLFMYFVAYVSLLFYGFAFNHFSDISNYFLLAALVLVCVREFAQLNVFRLNYFKRLDNLIDLFLITGISYILVSGWVQTLLNQNLQVAYSVVFLTSTLGIFLQLGNFPYFAIKVIILKQTSISFCKHMVFYIFPVMAFFFCFYMLTETEDNLFFQTLYEVITMYAGDPDSSYPEKFEANPIFSHIIYVCFIVLIGIILQNLLIGLAVSDLQEIQKEAEFIDKIERAEFITSIEKIVFSKHKFSTRKFSKKMFEKLVNIACVFKTQDEKVLVIQPYNDGCVYPKQNPTSCQFINDQNIISVLQTILKDLTMDSDGEKQDLLKAISDRLERIENLLKKLNLK